MRQAIIILFLSCFSLLIGARAPEAAESPLVADPAKTTAYSGEDVKRLDDFASTIGSSMACGVNIEEDLQLVAHWATITFGDDAPKRLAAFRERVEQMLASSTAALMRGEGISCSQMAQVRKATIDYLRSSLYLYRLEGRRLPAPSQE